MATLTANLVCNLHVKTHLRSGVRLWIAGRLCRIAAYLLGGKSSIDFDVEATTKVGNKISEPKHIGTIGTLTAA